jgi:small subunit ribosomal protein S1
MMSYFEPNDQETSKETVETVETVETPKEIQQEIQQEAPTVTEPPVQPEEKQEKPAPAPRTMQEEMIELYEETFSNIRPGQIMEGTVVSITDREVMVDIGYKSEGAIPLSEFANGELPERFSKVNVFINAVEDGEGKLKLSKRKADFYRNLEMLKKIFDSQETVTGVLKRRVKGGMIAEVLDLEAFLPGSQISLKPIPNLDQFIGKESKFKIIKLDEDRRNIIVSRKLVLEEELDYKRRTLKERIKIDSELDGEVKNITDYGAFIDLGGIDGLLHITDMSWGRIKHPSEMLNIGDRVKVKVIGYDEENGRVSLGLKQLVPHPWENIEMKYPEGARVSGKVVNVTNYGAFIELESGVEGLVHVSEMSWTRKISHPNQIVKVGDSVNAIVLSVSKEEQRISLGMKQMEANPWLTIDERYPVGAMIDRKIKSLTPFGAFVELESEIDGLIHISDISWTKRIYHPKEIFRVGQEVQAKILSIDKGLHRIALGVKQIEDDPWADLAARLPVNTEVNGKITKVIPKGVLVDVYVEGSAVEGFVPMSHLGIPRFDKMQFAFEAGEELPLKVIELDIENRRLILSVKAFFFGREKEEKIAFLKEHEKKIVERKPSERRPRAQQEDGAPVNGEEDGEELGDDYTEDSAEHEMEVGQTLDVVPGDEVVVVVETEAPVEEPAEASDVATDEEAVVVVETEVPVEEPAEASDVTTDEEAVVVVETEVPVEEPTDEPQA